METIGKRILFLRTHAGLTQDKLAEMIGKTKSNISGYENDKFEPSAQTIISICKLFKVSSDWLLFGEDLSFVPNLEQREELSPDDIELLAKIHMLGERDRIKIEERVEVLLEITNAAKESSLSRNIRKEDAATKQGA